VFSGNNGTGKLRFMLALKLMYAAIERASRTWQRVAITDFECRQLQTLREELNREFDEKHRIAKPSSRSRIYSKQGT